MTVEVYYYGRNIKLSYSPMVNSKFHEDFVKFNVRGIGKNSGNYSLAELNAQHCLIKNAIEKAPNLKLSQIVKIRQNIDYNPTNQLEICLKGIAFFERKK